MRAATWVLIVAVTSVAVAVGWKVVPAFHTGGHEIGPEASAPPAEPAVDESVSEPRDDDSRIPEVAPIRREATTNVGVESYVMANGGVSASRADRMLERPDFEQLIEKTTTASNASEMARANEYGTALSTAFKLAGLDDAITRLACGAKLCMASIATSSSDGEALLSAVAEVAELPGTTMYALNLRRIGDPAAPGQNRYRLIFTTDPAVAALVVPYEAARKNSR